MKAKKSLEEKCKRLKLTVIVLVVVLVIGAAGSSFLLVRGGC